MPQAVSVSRLPRPPPFGRESNVLPRFQPYPMPDTNAMPSGVFEPSSETQDRRHADTRTTSRNRIHFFTEGNMIPGMKNRLSEEFWKRSGRMTALRLI